MNELHSLLKRQLRRFNNNTKSSLEDQSDLIRAINDAYWQFDADRKMLEHSLELTSQELLERNEQLSRINRDLEARVEERTEELSSNEARFRALFEYAPISLWEEDFSAVRKHIDDLRRAGVVDFRAHFDAHPEQVADCAALVKIVDVNRATLEMYRAGSKDQLLENLLKILGPESLNPFKEELLALARGETNFEGELVNYTLNGEKLIVYLSFNVAPGYEQTWSKVFVGISDITQRRQAETALAVERDLLQALMDNIPDTIYFKDIASRFTRINDAQRKVLGVDSVEDAIGRTDLDFQSTELAQRFHEEEQQIIKTGQPLIDRIEFNPTPEGEPRWFSATKVPIKDENGRVTGIVGVSRDITERRQAEAALQESEAEMRALFSAMNDVIIVFDREARYVRIAPTSTDMMFVPPEEMVGKTVFDALPQDLAKTFHDAIQEVVRTQSSIHVEYQIEIRGQPTWKDAVVAPRTRDTVFWIAHDASERKRSEEALRRSEERFRLASWATKDALWDWNIHANQILWDTGLQKVFHYPPETTNTNIDWRRNHIHPQDRKKVDLTINQALEAGMEFWSKEYRFQRKDGTYANVMDRAYILRDDKGRPHRMIGAMMDITERKQDEETIRHQNDMLSGLHQITLDLLKHRNIDQLLSALVEISARFLDASFVEIMLAEGETLVVKAVTNEHSELIGRRMGRSDSLLSWQAFDTRQPVILEDYAAWPRRQAAYDEVPLHAVASFPILNDDQCLGVLGLGRDKPDFEFTPDQVQFGQLFANLTALVFNNVQLREALHEQSIHDPLTGLFNRRYMEEAFKQHLSRVTRQKHTLGIIMLDIDHFKRFNDTHGHVVGDALLREVGEFLQEHLRVEDIACRYGGEEFLMIMPGATLDAVRQRAEHLRQEVKGLRAQYKNRAVGKITLSLGVAVYPEHGSTQQSILRAADTALYRAKHEGRDRVVVAQREKTK